MLGIDTSALVGALAVVIVLVGGIVVIYKITNLSSQERKDMGIWQ